MNNKYSDESSPVEIVRRAIEANGGNTGGGGKLSKASIIVYL